MITISDVVLVSIIGGLFTLLSQYLTQRQNERASKKLQEEKRSELAAKSKEADGEFLANFGAAYHELVNGALARVTLLETRVATVEGERDRTEKRLVEVEKERDRLRDENETLHRQITELRAEIEKLKKEIC